MNWIFEAYSNVYKTAMMSRESLPHHAATAKSDPSNSRQERLSWPCRDH
jgi:hypothetical protein